MHSLNLKTGRNQVCILQYGYDNTVVLPGESGETNCWQSKIAIFCFTYKQNSGIHVIEMLYADVSTVRIEELPEWFLLHTITNILRLCYYIISTIYRI